MENHIVVIGSRTQERLSWAKPDGLLNTNEVTFALLEKSPPCSVEKRIIFKVKTVV